MSTITRARVAPKPVSPHVASWLGTFVAAGIQLSINSRGDKAEKRAKRKLYDGIKMALLGPAIGLALWRLFSSRENTHKLLPIVTASFIGSGLLSYDDEVESVNGVIWLRIASGILAGLGRRGSDIITHMAIVTTFYGVVNHTHIAPSMLVKMTRRFLTLEIFNAVKTDDKSERKLSIQDALTVFVRCFKGLFAYNYFLHFAAAIVSYVVRKVGSRAVKGAKPSNMSVPTILIQAAKEASILNTAVSASCALLVAGSAFGGKLPGVLLMPLPLYFCAPRVRDTVYFLFMPWSVKYLFRLHNIGNILNARLRLLLGVCLLEGPLRMFSHDHEGYAWMIGVAFGLVKSAGSGLI